MRFKRVFWHHHSMHILCVDVCVYTHKFVLTFEIKKISLLKLFIILRKIVDNNNFLHYSQTFTKTLKNESFGSHRTFISNHILRRLNNNTSIFAK